MFVEDDTKYRYLLNQNKSYSDDLDTVLLPEFSRQPGYRIQALSSESLKL